MFYFFRKPIFHEKKSFNAETQLIQKHIQNPFKHLRWIFLQKLLATEKHSPNLPVEAIFLFWTTFSKYTGATCIFSIFVNNLFTSDANG